MWSPEARLNWRDNNREKINAHAAVQKNPHKVKVIYECPCADSHKIKHHYDYSYARRYEVLLLCMKCHAAEHKRLRNLKTGEARNSKLGVNATITDIASTRQSKTVAQERHNNDISCEQ